MNRKTILVIDTEGFLYTAVGQIFARTGANISLVHDEVDSMRELYLLRPDLILIYLEISNRTGINTLRNLRRRTSVPIIVVSSSSCHDDLLYFEAGADACIKMSGNLDDLLARIRAMLRGDDIKFEQHLNAIYDDGHLTIDHMANQITVGGNPVRLTPLECKLLVYLVNNSYRLCTYSQILERVWGVSNRNKNEYVHTYIWQLRKKLQGSPQESEYIESVYGIGYRFNAHKNGVLERLGNGQLLVAKSV